MIFVTTGTQIPFDRLIKTIDELAAELDEEVIAQAISSEYQPKNIKLMGFIEPDKFNDIFSEARIIVAHAGMGTIISSLTKQKPIVVIPRFAFLGEHRNEHQMATAMKLNELGYINVAYDKKQLKEYLEKKEELHPLKIIDSFASEKLTNDILNFIKL